METSRRSVLKAGGTVALLSVTSLAGCSGILGGDVSPADYQYDPATLVETQNRFFGLADYAGLYEARDNFPESTQESFESSEDTPVNPEDIETMVGVGGAQISMSDSGGGAFFGSFGLLGSFDKSTIEESIQSEGNAQQSGEYEGFTLYENTESGSSDVVGGGVPSDATATVAAGDGTVIIGFAAANGEGEAGVTGDQAARTMIDAGNGDAELLNDNSDYASSLRDRIGDSSVMMGGEIDPGLVELATQSGGMQTQFVNGIRAGGFGMTVDGETTTMSAVGIYTDSQAAEDSGVVELVDFASDQAVDESQGIDSVDAEYDGNAVVVSVEGQTQTIFDQGMGGGAGGGFDVRRPQAALGRAGSIGQ